MLGCPLRGHSILTAVAAGDVDRGVIRRADEGAAAREGVEHFADGLVVARDRGGGEEVGVAGVQVPQPSVGVAHATQCRGRRMGCDVDAVGHMAQV